MNNRIKELGLQAADWLDDQEPVNTAHAMQLYQEKFAELIVRECAELAVNSQYANTKSEYYEGFNEALIYAGNKIRQHFGVEE